MIRHGAQQIKAHVVIGEPMPQVATHDYKPGREPVTIRISKEANLRDITRATAHEVAEIFQRKYVEEIEKGVAPKIAEQRAAAETPYVKARGKLGYTDIEVKIVSTSMVMMGIPPRRVVAPSTIQVTARKGT